MANHIQHSNPVGSILFFFFGVFAAIWFAAGSMAGPVTSHGSLPQYQVSCHAERVC